MQPILIALAAVMVMCGVAQVVVIIKLAALRKQFGHLPHLSKQPRVRTCMQLSLGVTVVCVLATIAAVVIAKRDGQPFLLGLVPVLLMVAAHTVSDNDTSHGDGDSGE